ncbi:hypothetical protein HPG27_1335 [Helicobacter pylori G27]|uniref:HP0423 family protein n=1 Tax=Helicobacter pylori (strain G27) TaxID=563041 RepID=B5Z934_HELPG|nr:hypothetical protein [Helicobacter pylori]ACI28083.1 hypothetical protein HPG27_1335 [Helicobacter pylori G27]UEB14464.1 hypothetical protein LK447_01940 [Helicobacter pylori]
MGFQNENKLKVGASVKATINNKVVEAKVINIGFNCVTLRSQKGNEAAYAFNSDKFLKWFNKVPLTEHMRLHAENKKVDILDGIKVVTSGPSVKDRTSTPKEKEDRFKLAFEFREANEEGVSVSELMIRDYTLTERKSRLGVLLSPMLFSGNGSQISALIITALANAKGFNKHSDAEWVKMIDNRDEELCEVDSFDNLDRVALTLYCNVIKYYAEGREEFQNDFNDFSPDGFWAKYLPANKSEALFVAQLICDGGINKYGLSCTDLTENLLKDIELNFGLATTSEIDEYLDNLDKEETESKE